MSNKPKRRSRSALATTHSSSGTFWSTIASYAGELAPVAAPLLDVIAQTAAAIERANRRTSSLDSSTDEPGTQRVH
jgi:hypothetical protein